MTKGMTYVKCSTRGSAHMGIPANLNIDDCIVSSLDMEWLVVTS